MRRIVMFAVLAVPLAFPATAHAFGCIGGGFGRSFTLPAGRSHRPFSFAIPQRGTLRVQLSYSHTANPGAKFVVRLRRSTWGAPKTLIDSRTAGVCRTAGVHHHLPRHASAHGRGQLPPGRPQAHLIARSGHAQRVLGGAAGRGGRDRPPVPACRRPEPPPVRARSRAGRDGARQAGPLRVRESRRPIHRPPAPLQLAAPADHHRLAPRGRMPSRRRHGHLCRIATGHLGRKLRHRGSQAVAGAGDRDARGQLAVDTGAGGRLLQNSAKRHPPTNRGLSPIGGRPRLSCPACAPW